jgi:ppGpp synthetase/RelA/SpoT-type nucleotidyltranferase
MTKAQINKLGELLRTTVLPRFETFERLEEFRASYYGPLARAQTILKDQLGIEATARIKTVNTTIEKLVREKTRLAAMQDIAGLRIVRDMGLAAQDVLVADVARLFPAAKIVDRRTKPSHGYRAVHVVAVVDDHPVEIQVRTVLQDLWAQAMERLADEVGRGIRYGEPPQGRGSDVERLMRVSHVIAEIERLRDQQQSRSEALATVAPGAPLSASLAELRTLLDGLSEQIRDILK